MIPRVLLSRLLIVSPLLAAGCATSPQPDAPGVAQTPVSAEDTPEPVSERVVVEEREAWPRPFLSRGDIPAGDVAFAAGGMVVTDEEYTAGLEAFASERGMTPDQARPMWNKRLEEELLTLSWLEANAARAGLGEEEVRRVLREELAEWVWAKYAVTRSEVTQQEIEARYERDAALYTQPTRVAVRLILVPTQAAMDEVKARLETGEAFADIAEEVSIHSSAPEGGEIDPFPRGTYSAALEDLAFRLTPGETGTVETNRGLFLIEKVAEIRGAQTPLEDVALAIEAALREEKEAAARRAFLERIATGGPSAGADFGGF